MYIYIHIHIKEKMFYFIKLLGKYKLKGKCNNTILTRMAKMKINRETVIVEKDVKQLELSYTSSGIVYYSSLLHNKLLQN